ncbi:hypothetical protein Q1695_008238 [Nippostrongylus brasiliensis]|nr:hypothetical protein Q1695_008238 [Nippostrongylus brasiliensis]
MITVAYILVVVLYFHTWMNVCCKHGGGEGDDGTKEDAKSESEKTPQLKTCLDIDEVCEEKTQCDEGMGELEAGVWEEAGEVDQRDISPHLKHAPKHVDGKQDAAKPKKKEVTNGKRLSSDKDDVDIEAKLKALEETQAEVVEYKSIMEPVNMDMINVKNEDIRAGSLADLILQVNKVKAEKIERMKNASRQAEAQRYVEEQKERMKNASRQDEAQGTLPPAAPQTEPLKAALTEWKDSITTATWLADNGYLAVIKQFQEMVRAGALMVGCSESVCAGGVVASAGCIFNLPPLKNGDVVFKSGKGCTAGGPCDTYPSSKCDSTAGLCVTSSASTTASTAASTATTVASGSSTASGATSAPSAGNVICPGNTNMNDRIREKALTMHNYRRSQLASGNIAKNNGRYLPTAADMVQLKYDCDLEKAAKAHADTCSFAYSSAASSASTSENIATIPKTSTVVNRVDATSEAIKSWWKNVRTQTVNIGMLVTFKQKHVGYPIESFIKMAWAKSTKFGCGAKLCSNNNFFVVCQYTPKGAIVNQVVYQTGSPCAACPAASSCVSPLCVYA